MRQIVIGLVATFACVGVASAQPSEVEKTIRCIAASVAVINEAGVDPTNKTQPAPVAALTSFHYYLGRLDGMNPPVNIADELAKQLTTMSRRDRGFEQIRCGAWLMERGQAIFTAGKELEARERRGFKPD